MTAPEEDHPSGDGRPAWRAGLDLARAGNFPSVWSNVLAACILSARTGASWPPLGLWAAATAAGTLAYAGGATWNDVCDAGHDARLQPRRPIPSGRISRQAASWLGAAELGCGLAIFCRAGASPGAALALLAVILAYDLVHKRWAGSVLLMAGCRALLALLVATLPGHGFQPALLAWIGALFLYIVALSLVARREYRPGTGSPALGPVVRRLLAFMPLVDAAALGLAGAFLPAAGCAAAVPLGRWAQRRAASS